MARPVCLCALLILALGLPAVAHADAEGRAAAPTDAVSHALVRLASPLEGERQLGAERLEALMGGDGRARILAALASAPEAVQQELIAIFARDAGADAIEALLEHLVRATPEQANAVMLALARTPAAVKFLGPLLAKDKQALRVLASPDGKKKLPADAKKRMKVFEHILRRSELESLLISRKSPTGGTGYYQGQYDVLVNYGHRELALSICMGIALDEAVAIPGIFTGGVYEFVYPHEVDIWELRGMAINAVSELATRDDEDVIRRLDEKFSERWRYVLRRRSELSSEAEQSNAALESKRFQDARFELGADVSELADYLLCLYLINPDKHRETLDDFIDDLEYGWRFPVRPQHIEGMIPGVMIRARRYSDAVDAYIRDRRGFNSSRSFIDYNLACAYASWSRDPGERKKEWLEGMAIRSLRSSFHNGWRDLGWMEEDRDLDPIRKSKGYRDVVQMIKDDLGLK